MSNKPHDVTPQAVVEFARNLYSLLAEKFGGDTTLNELRVMNQIILCHIRAGAAADDLEFVHNGKISCP